MTAPIDLAARRPAEEPAPALRTYRRVVTITMEIDTSIAFGAQASGYLDQVVNAFQGLLQQAAGQGVHGTISVSKHNRSLGNGWLKDEAIILPGGGH